jgi:hypothetical protein
MLDWMIGISTGQTMGIYSMDANSGPPGFGGSGGGIPQTPQPQTPGVSTPVSIYGVIDLVTVGGGNQSYANGINNSVEQWSVTHTIARTTSMPSYTTMLQCKTSVQ